MNKIKLTLFILAIAFSILLGALLAHYTIINERCSFENMKSNVFDLHGTHYPELVKNRIAMQARDSCIKEFGGIRLWK